jgi:hypothetical protein
MIHKMTFREIWYQVQNRKLNFLNQLNQEEKKGNSQIAYEYKLGDQVLLETPGILRELSTPCTELYHVKNVYKNVTIRIQK